MARSSAVESIRHQVAIAGRVTEAQTQRPLSGAQVTITAAPAAFTAWLALRAMQYGERWDALGQRPDRTRTAPDGHFHFLDLPNGPYTLTVSWPGTGSRYGTAEVNARVTRPRRRPDMITCATADIALPPTTLQGQITDAATHEAVCLTEVLVQGSGERTCSDAEGNYCLAGLEVGRRTVQVSAQGYTVHSTTVQLRQAGAVQQLDVSLDKTGTQGT